MATSIFFNGRRIVVPQVASRIDATALDAVGPSAVGIVALVGTAEGGEPLTVALENDLTTPQQAQDQYRSGDLRTASLFSFDPSLDEAIPGGAQRVVPVKVNPATQSTAQLLDDSSNASADLTSRDYGQFTEQINIDVAAGTTQGKQYVIVFGDVTETFDDVGGDAAFTLLYTPGTEGYSTITGAVTAANFTVAAAKAELGLGAEMTDTTPGGFPSAVDLVSSAAGDTTQSATVYGIAGGVATQETVALNGTTNVQTTTTTWTKVLGVVLDAACVGTVTLSDFPVTNTIATIAPATLARGVALLTNSPASSVLTVSIDTDTAGDVAVFGTSSTGAAQAEAFDLTTGATTPVTGSVTFSGELTVLALGDFAAARTVTVSLTAVQTDNSVFRTVQQLVDRLNVFSGLTATATATNSAELLVTELDYSTAVSLLATASFFADLNAFLTAVNQGSQYLTAARASGASLPPANTTSPVFLQGGVEGTTTITEWQAAFDLLRKRRVNIIVPLTEDPAVHSLLRAHLNYRAGEGQSEANGYVGLGTAAGAGDTLSTIRTEIQAINNRNVSSVSEEVQRFDPLTGEATWYPPYILAAIAAGMQAGSPIGEPLTRKVINALDVRNDSSWARETDADILIDSGLMMTEKVDGIGIRWVRSVTTFLQNNNLVFTEMSANESANTSVFNLRRAVDQKIGDRALAASVSIIKGIIVDELQRQVTDEVIAAFRPETLTVEQVGDVFPVSVEIAPVVPINFIPVTVHLVPLRATA